MRQKEVHAEVWGGYYGLRKRALSPQDINGMGFADIMKGVYCALF